MSSSVAASADNVSVDAEAAAVAPAPRAALAATQLDELRSHVPQALAAPVVLTALLLVFVAGPGRTVVLGALAGLGAVAGIALLLSRLPVGRTVEQAHGLRIAAAIGCLAGLFAVLPLALVYAGAEPAQRLLLVAFFCAALGNVSLFGSAWPVGPAYVAPLLAGGIYGLVAGGDAVSLALAGVLLVAGGIIGHVLDGNRRLVSGQFQARLEVGEHAFTIDRLLLDFEETDHEWLWEVDARLRLRNIAPRMAEAAALEGTRLDGMAVKTLLVGPEASDKDDDGATLAVLEAMKLRQPFRNRTVRVEGRDGPVWWRLSARPILDAQGRFLGYRGVGADITAAHTAEARIAYLASHDLGTGLANRMRFQAHVAQECASIAHGGHGGALLAIDIDGFRSANDRLGHAAGDEVLKEVARRLRDVAGPDAFVARRGGDEFAIWSPSAVPARAMALADRVVAALNAPFVLDDGAEIELGAGVGIALAPKHSSDADLLAMRADLALYRAKAEGRNGAQMFAEEFEQSIAVQRALEAELRLALARQEFELWYQPIVDSLRGQVVAFEALIRWRSPTRGFVSPTEFIPAAEAAGLIVAIDCWVLRRACKDAAGWPDGVHVAVNVSPNHFRTKRLLQDVEAALRLSGLDPHRLDIEVTEGVFLDRSKTALETLQTLRKLGVLIALDDFGTGYSSLSYLIDFPIDKIKIDRAFVRDFVERHESRAIVDAMLSLARKLSIKVVAEGVETEEQALALKLRRCDQLQGYLLDRPRPASQVPAMLAGASANYRDAVPSHVDSALGMALALKKQAI